MATSAEQRTIREGVQPDEQAVTNSDGSTNSMHDTLPCSNATLYAATVQFLELPVYFYHVLSGGCGNASYDKC